MVTKELVQAIAAQHLLRERDSIHFIDHWARVFEFGSLLSPRTGARLAVVELFAVFHDAGRRSDSRDPEHGRRGAEIAVQMRGKLFDLDDSGMELLLLACRDHTLGATQADVTVQTCWDSDRLDLGRAAITPLAELLCTPAARDPDTIRWASERSMARYRPAQILSSWGMGTPARGAGKPHAAGEDAFSLSGGPQKDA